MSNFITALIVCFSTCVLGAALIGLLGLVGVLGTQSVLGALTGLGLLVPILTGLSYLNLRAAS